MSEAWPQEIDINEFRERFGDGQEDYTLVDVREADEYEAGHIPGAVLVPLSFIESHFQEAMAYMPTDKPIVLVCARGARSAIAGSYMIEAGYTNEVINLVDGTLGWVLRGLPIEK